jgi:hypothetical protein
MLVSSNPTSLAHRVRRTLQILALFLAFPSSAYCQNSLVPEIQTPTPPKNNSAAMETLERARLSVDKFFESSSNVVCAESITQSIVGRQGKAAYREESRYTYQVETTSASGAIKLKEFREARKVAFRDPARTLLVTNGFASLLLIVHSTYEASYQFEPGEEQTIDGTVLQEIRFKPIPGGASPAALQLRGKSYPLPLSGSVWIDKQSGAITRLTAAVDSSLKDLGLQGMSSDIHYSLIQFHDPEEAYWMPASAVIDVETPLQHWRNVHRFAAYRRFKATIEVEMGKAE